MAAGDFHIQVKDGARALADYFITESIPDLFASIYAATCAAADRDAGTVRISSRNEFGTPGIQVGRGIDLIHDPFPPG
jgi:hypothetical protein